MTTPKLDVPTLHLASRQHYACIQCGQCCRRWHVALSRNEVDQLRGMKRRHFPDMEVDDPVTTIKGHPYIAHRADGACVFLDRRTQLCRIHQQFGEGAKPFGCRVYPLNIGATYPGEASAALRLDCPAVQRDTGPALASYRSDIEDYAQTLAPVASARGFDADDLSQFTRSAAEQVVAGALEIIRNPQLPPPLATIMLSFYVERLKQLGSPFVNDVDTFRTVLPALLERLRVTVLSHRYRPVAGFSRAVFRQWLGAYLRRDEEMVAKPFSQRVQRMGALTRILLGRGNPRALGGEHPDIELRNVPLFVAGREPVSPPSEVEPGHREVWGPFLRCVEARLETGQFFSRFYYGAPLLQGLRALALMYPLVLAAARCKAFADTGEDIIRTEHVQYAVGAIDHGFGRSGLLQNHLLRSTEIFFGGLREASLLATLSWL